MVREINYNEVSKIYDDVRAAEVDVINSFLAGVELSAQSKILDIGCGTGNYANILQTITQAQTYGIDASSGMLDKARAKNPRIQFFGAEATQLPFEENMFDFVYMTDVIHHITDINALLLEISRVLVENGKCCIATQSHGQIDSRYTSEFFPATAVADKNRYPDIPVIIETGCHAGLKHIGTDIVAQGEPYMVGDHYLELVEKKGFSMFHLISNSEYEEGLEKLRELLKNGPIMRKTAGDSLVWLQKK